MKSNQSLYPLTLIAASEVLLGGAFLQFQRQVFDREVPVMVGTLAILIGLKFLQVLTNIGLEQTRGRSITSSWRCSADSLDWKNLLLSDPGKIEKMNTWIQYELPRSMELQASVQSASGVIIGTLLLLLHWLHTSQNKGLGLFLVLLVFVPFMGERIGGQSYQSALQLTRASGDLMRIQVRHFLDAAFNTRNGTTQRHVDLVSQRIEKVAAARDGLTRVLSLRNLAQTALSEVPYLLCLAAGLVAWSEGELTLGALLQFVGLGFWSIRVGQAAFQVQSSRRELSQLEIRFSDLLSVTDGKELGITETCTSDLISIPLREGAPISFARKPGIHWIQRPNGSGKTTALRSYVSRLPAEERENVLWVHPSIARLNLDREESLSSRLACASGALKSILPEQVFSELIRLNSSIEEVTPEKRLRPYSKGELAFLSLTSALCQITQGTHTLLIDEAESGLDENLRELFFETVLFLSQFLSVHWVTHEESVLEWFRGKVPILLMACDERGGSGMGVPSLLSLERDEARGLTDDAAPLVRGIGNVGVALSSVLSRNLRVILRRSPADCNLFRGKRLVLSSELKGAVVRQSESAGMALSIGVYQLIQAERGTAPILGLTGTGWLREDGSFDGVKGEQAKQVGVSYLSRSIQFLTTESVPTLVELRQRLDQR